MWYPLAKHLKAHAKAMQGYLFDDFTGLDIESRRQKAAEVRKTSAVAAAAIAPMPIPFADIWTITPIQMLMVKAIGNIYGYGADERTTKAILATIGGGWLGKQAFLGILKLGLPGLGEIGGAAFAYWWTQGIGKAAEAYFAGEINITQHSIEQAFRRHLND